MPDDIDETLKKLGKEIEQDRRKLLRLRDEIEKSKNLPPFIIYPDKPPVVS